MPVFIDEVVISLDVQWTPSSTSTPAIPSPDEKQALIAECVDRVLEVLVEWEER